MSYVFYRETDGVREYLKEDKTFTRDGLQAKEYKGKFWIELLKILLQIVQVLGINLKIQKR